MMIASDIRNRVTHLREQARDGHLTEEAFLRALDAFEEDAERIDLIERAPIWAMPPLRYGTTVLPFRSRPAPGSDDPGSAA